MSKLSKLTIINDGCDGSRGYYVERELYSEIHSNDFTSEIEDTLCGIMVSHNISAFNFCELTESDVDKYVENDYKFAENMNEYQCVKEDGE